MKANNLLRNFSFRIHDVRAFKVFKLAAGCIFKCETANMKLPKNIGIGF